MWTFFAPSPLRPPAKPVSSLTEPRPESVVTALVAAFARPNSFFGLEKTPTLFACSISALMNACWSWIRPRSLPSPTLLRGTDELEGLLAVQGVGAGLQVEVALGSR
ncbi:hypothetical protein SMICM17S_03806 [Streptomyces microflavus]